VGRLGRKVIDCEIKTQTLLNESLWVLCAHFEVHVLSSDPTWSDAVMSHTPYPHFTTCQINRCARQKV